MKTLRRIRYLLNRAQAERELAEEIDLHRARSGNPREMGNTTLAREDARAVWIWPWLQSVWQDISYAIRSLRREPGFTLVALAMLGTAIGLNTSLFSTFNAVALKPWPVKDPGRMVKVFGRSVRINGVSRLSGLSVAEYRFFAEHSKSLSGFVYMRRQDLRLGFEPFGSSTGGALVGGDHFRVLGVEMTLGRGFLPEEDRIQDPAAVAVLSYRLWRDHYGSDGTIVGKQIRFKEIPFTVVGVAPPSFLGASDSREDLWMPLPALLLLDGDKTRARNVLENSQFCCSNAAGRLAGGVSREQGRAELELLSRRFHAESGGENHAIVLTGTAFLAGDNDADQVLPVFLLMFLGVALVLLLACANVGNLLIARAAARQKEIAMRRSLGASRGRIVRQLLTESALLALAAGSIGALLAYWLPAFFIEQFTHTPLPFSLALDWRVLGFALAAAAAACICFGLAPALHGTRTNPGRDRLRLRSVLLSAQVALSLVLLVGAGLMLNGVARARNLDPGFAIADVSVVSLEFPASAYDGKRMQAFNAALENALKSEPGPFGFTSLQLFSEWNTVFVFPGEDRSRSKRVDFQDVSPGYFEVLRIPIVAGRNLAPGDFERRAIVINETMARRYWNGASPLGSRIIVAGLPREIVGVVKDTYSSSLATIQPSLYQPLSGTTPSKVLVRSSDPAAAASVTAAATQIEPRVRTNLVPLQESLDRALEPALLSATLAGVLGLFALVLATVGMFGVFAYAVEHRTKEIGIRMALGALPGQVIAIVVGTSSRAIAFGLAIGFLASLAESRLLREYLYGLSPLDPRAYVGAAVILAAAGLAASFVPARRATRIDPIATLRHE